MATFFRNVYYAGDPVKDVLQATLGETNMLRSDWVRSIRAIVVQEGYTLCLFDQPYLQTNPGNTHCFESGSVPDLSRILRGSSTRDNWSGVAQSYKLFKDCDHPQWAWDEECKRPDGIKVVGHCEDKTSKCYQNRLQICATMDDLDENCVAFCANNNGLCDRGMARYCMRTDNKDKDICNCINSPASKYNPRCIDSKCIRGGYMTSNMLQGTCPDVIDCSVYNNIKNSGGTVEMPDAHIEQRCGNKDDGTGSGTGTGTTPMEPTPNPMMDMIVGNIWIVLVVVLVLVVILVIYFFSGTNTVQTLQNLQIPRP